MSGYGEGGEEGQVEHEKYCMKKSMQAKNVDEMNSALGYEDESDLANTRRFPVEQVGEHRNVQEGPVLANPRHNDRS